MSNPTNLQYTAQHEWVELDGDTARVGVTGYAADALGELVYVDLPRVGSPVTAGESCGELESTKSVSDLYSPVTGEVVAINEDLDVDPSLVNSDSFGEGWLYVVRVATATELLDAAAYDTLVAA